jgi:phosphatidylglycerophosphate synthase
MSDVYNGYISRYLNRRISDPVAGLLARTRLTPNQVTWATLGIAVLSFGSFFLGYNILGGLLAQLTAIVDGVDGSLARIKGMVSEFGGFLDSVTDRYADMLIVLGLILWSLANETYPGVWLAGFLAIFGTVCLSYTRSRISPEHRPVFDRGLKSIASRDIRLFLIMLGGVFGQAYVCLITIAALTNLVVFYRLIHAYRIMK